MLDAMTHALTRSATRTALGAALALAVVGTACGGSAASTPPAAPKTEAKPAEAAKPAATPSPAAAPGAAPPASAAASPAASPVAASPGASPSPAAGVQTVSGEVDAVDGRTVTVVTNTGVRRVQVADNATVLMEGRGTVADLTPGTFVGVTSRDGTAASIRLFPPGISPKPSQFPMTGPQAGNTMTNARIESFDGTALRLDLGGEKASIAVPPSVEVLKPTPSTFAEIQAGRRVVAIGSLNGDVLVAQTVTVFSPPR